MLKLAFWWDVNIPREEDRSCKAYLKTIRDTQASVNDQMT